MEYIYTFGEESGIEVKILNYPRFPKSKAKLKAQAMGLAMDLLIGLSQGSLSIVSDDETVFMSRRKCDE
jgi:hypothetical protein